MFIELRKALLWEVVWYYYGLHDLNWFDETKEEFVQLFTGIVELTFKGEYELI